MLDDFDMPNTPSPSSRDSSGILRTKIQLGRKPSVIMPFYLMKPDLPQIFIACYVPASAPITGSVNLLSYYGLNHAWSKFCGSKKLKEELSSFLPNLPGNIDVPGHVDGSLKALVEKPPITGKEIHPLSNTALAGFNLQPGSIPEHLKPVGYGTVLEKKRHKRKHEKAVEEDRVNEDDFSMNNAQQTLLESERKAKRMKKDEEKEAKKKKKKKDKKKRKAGPLLEENLSSVSTAGPVAPSSSSAVPTTHSLSNATDFFSF